jgi:hypothetical protein
MYLNMVYKKCDETEGGSLWRNMSLENFDTSLLNMIVFRFEVLTVVCGEDVDVGLLGCNAMWTVGRYQFFRKTYCLHLQP